MISKNNTVLGIDIGGTSINAGLVNCKNGKIIDNIISYDTPEIANVEAILDIITTIKMQYNWNGNVGCGFPGVIKEGKIYTAANLSNNWINQNIKLLLRSIFTGKINVINDADAVGIAEIRFGIGKSWKENKYSTILFITLGTGIGSSLFINGQLVPNTEFGHIPMNDVTAEKLAATVIKDLENLSWKEWGNRVNNYLQLMYKLLSPDCIIIGGGISKNPELFFKYLDIPCNIFPTQSGNDAGIIGAALSTIQ